MVSLFLGKRGEIQRMIEKWKIERQSLEEGELEAGWRGRRSRGIAGCEHYFLLGVSAKHLRDEVSTTVSQNATTGSDTLISGDMTTPHRRHNSTQAFCSMSLQVHISMKSTKVQTLGAELLRMREALRKRTR